MSAEQKHAAAATRRRFKKYVDNLATALGHADRVAPFSSYTTGLMLPGDRKSVEPMAARIAPDRVRATHQSMHHFVAQAEWSDRASGPATLQNPIYIFYGTVSQGFSTKVTFNNVPQPTVPIPVVPAPAVRKPFGRVRR